MKLTKEQKEKFTLYLRCQDCGHKWKMLPAVIVGERGVYGSDADFCPKCDGTPQGNLN